MTVATEVWPPSVQRRMTLEEYLDYDDGADVCYELVDGVLVEMGAESPINNVIASFLFSVFLGLGIPYYRLIIGHQVGVAEASSRQPDFIVHTEDSLAATLADRILLPMQPNPMLVVEVVSNSNSDKKSRERDYVDKRSEYAARGIAEYWIIDPVKEVVLILSLQDDRYVDRVLMGDDKVVSPTFLGLNLTAMQVLSAGR
jgi:Uma2 family endonuclease